MAYAERLRRQQDLLQTLRHATLAASTIPLDSSGNLFDSVLSKMAVSPDLRFRNYQQKTRLQGCQSFADLHNSSSPEQRQNAVKKLQSYLQDLRLLARQT
jgi:hypothetical protein